MNLTIETKPNMDEALLRELFKVIKKNNYCEEKLEDFKASIIREIEYFYIRYLDVNHVFIEDCLRPVLDSEIKDYRIKSEEYYDISCRVYDGIQHKLLDFCNIQKNKDSYRDSSYSDKAKRELIINSLEIVESEIWKPKNLDLYQDISKKIEKIKNEIKQEDGLLAYTNLLKDSKTNFVVEGRNRKYFYPIIVDMYLDYAAIKDNILINEKEIKKRTKRYTDYVEKVKQGEHVISDTYYYFMKFSKKERVENIKRFVLQFYLDKFNNNKNINTLFRKLHLLSLDNDKRFTPSDMKKYKKKIHNIFVLGANISRFV